MLPAPCGGSSSGALGSSGGPLAPRERESADIRTWQLNFFPSVSKPKPSKASVPFQDRGDEKLQLLCSDHLGVLHISL